MARSQKEDKMGLIKKGKMLTVEYTPEGMAVYVCNQNKVNAKLHPKFGDRREARRHIMTDHYFKNMPVI